MLDVIKTVLTKIYEYSLQPIKRYYDDLIGRKITETNTMLSRSSQGAVSYYDNITIFSCYFVAVASKVAAPFFLSQLIAHITEKQEPHKPWEGVHVILVMGGSSLMLGALFETMANHYLTVASIKISRRMCDEIVKIQLNQDFDDYSEGYLKDEKCRDEKGEIVRTAPNEHERIARATQVQTCVLEYKTKLWSIIQLEFQLVFASLVLGIEQGGAYLYILVPGSMVGSLLYGNYVIRRALNSKEQHSNLEKEIGQLSQALQESYSPVHYETIVLSQMNKDHFTNSIQPLTQTITNQFLDYHTNLYRIHRNRDIWLLIVMLVATGTAAYTAESPKYHFTAKNFSVIIQVLTSFLPPLRGLDDNIHNFLSTIATMEGHGYYHLLAPSLPNPNQFRPTQSYLNRNLFSLYDIKCKAVTIGHANSHPLIIEKRETVALVGKSGSGKTTIARLVSGLYKPENNRNFIVAPEMLTLEGVLDLAKIAVISQEIAGFSHLNLYDNICYGYGYGLDQVTPQHVANVLQMLGLQAKWEQEQEIEKIESPIDQRAARIQFYSHFSKGERQRISLARALVKATAPGNQVKLFILDEATSALDAENENSFIEYVNKHCRELGVSLLIITHRLHTIQAANSIYYIENGKLVEQGTHQQLTSFLVPSIPPVIPTPNLTFSQGYYKHLLNSNISFFGNTNQQASPQPQIAPLQPQQQTIAPTMGGSKFNKKRKEHDPLTENVDPPGKRLKRD